MMINKLATALIMLAGTETLMSVIMFDKNKPLVDIISVTVLSLQETALARVCSKFSANSIPSPEVQLAFVTDSMHKVTLDRIIPKLINRCTMDEFLLSERFFKALDACTRTLSDVSTNRMLSLLKMFDDVSASKENLLETLKLYKSASSMHAFCRFPSSREARSASSAVIEVLPAFGVT